MTALPSHRGRVVAVDPGAVRIGLAISDESRTLARPLDIVRRDAPDPVGRLAARILAEQPAEVIVGLPLQPDGSVGPKARQAQRFAQRLSKAIAPVRVILWDERYSTADARDILRQCGASRRRRQQPPDAIAAAVILQSYLDHGATPPPATDKSAS